MKRKLLLALTAPVMIFTLAACSGTCKEDGCDKEEYEDGYCEVHYYLHAGKDALEDLLG